MCTCFDLKQGTFEVKYIIIAPFKASTGNGVAYFRPCATASGYIAHDVHAVSYDLS